MNLQIRNEQSDIIIPGELGNLLRKAFARLGEEEEISPEAEITLVLTDDVFISALNERYRDITGPTDVLSFSMQEAVSGEPEIIDGPDIKILGDIVVSLETAGRQAEEQGFSLEKEVVNLAVHGLLHLIGYDHKTGVEKDVMLNKQELVLNYLGL